MKFDESKFIDMKPSDIFFGVTDFFSVLLPGCLLTWVAYQYDLYLTFGRTFSIPSSEIGQFAYFLLVSYTLGHVIFIISSKIDDWFYDRYRKKYLNLSNDSCFENAKKLKISTVSDEIMNTYKYSQHFIGLKNPEMLAEIKKIEADSKFFRSLIIAFLIIAILLIFYKEWLQSLFFLVSSFLSFFPYAKLRFKATQKAYELFITLICNPKTSVSN